jgi:hypothetical protein
VVNIIAYDMVQKSLKLKKRFNYVFLGRVGTKYLKKQKYCNATIDGFDPELRVGAVRAVKSSSDKWTFNVL